MAQEQEKKENDIDIILKFSQSIGWEIMEVREYFETLLGLDVDILTYKALLRKPSLWNSIKEDLVYF